MKKESINDGDVLVFQGGKTSRISIIKDGRKYTEFRCIGNQCRYRFTKGTGEIQSAPYWNRIQGMYIKAKEE